MLDIKEDEKGVVFKVKVQPRASKNKIAGLYGDAVKINITAPPVDGEANKACLLYLARVFNVSKKQVELVSGQTGRNKTIRVFGVDKQKAFEILGM